MASKSNSRVFACHRPFISPRFGLVRIQTWVTVPAAFRTRFSASLQLLPRIRRFKTPRKKVPAIMKVAIFSPYATVVPHFETELDIAQQHLDNGDLVEFVNCTGGLANCDFNTERDPQRCQQCIGRRQMGLELLQPQVRSEDFSENLGLPQAIRTQFASVEELISYRIENFDIGYAALSSLVSFCRDPEPDLELHQELLTRFLLSGWQSYEKTRSYLAREKPDRVYVFNGRFAAMRAVFSRLSGRTDRLLPS